MNAPVKFQGTEEERRANRATHNFQSYDHEEPAECMDCCAREYHVAADYPCGVAVPREETGTFVNGLGLVVQDIPRNENPYPQLDQLWDGIEKSIKGEEGLDLQRIYEMSSDYNLAEAEDH